jgi:asparagine synthetase A
LKLCLDREKRKNAELKSIVAKLHHKIREANALIESSIHGKATVPKEELLRFYETLVDSVKYKLFVSNSSEHPQALSSAELSKFLEN